MASMGAGLKDGLCSFDRFHFWIILLQIQHELVGVLCCYVLTLRGILWSDFCRFGCICRLDKELYFLFFWWYYRWKKIKYFLIFLKMWLTGQNLQPITVAEWIIFKGRNLKQDQAQEDPPADSWLIHGFFTESCALNNIKQHKMRSD